MSRLAIPDPETNMHQDPRLVHIILTRFNCRFKGGDFPTRNQPGWLEHRFALFERYCLPTLKAQTSSDFEWMLYFDSNTPAEYLDHARRLFIEHPNFHIRLTELYSGEWLINDIHEHLSNRCDWLLSTRLDNDDGLNERFVERVQKELQYGQKEVLNFPDGLVLCGEKLYGSRQSSNAFLSVSEPFKTCKTALHAPHKDMALHMPLRDIMAGPMWLQVIHAANVSNKRRGRRMLRSRMPPGFESVPDFAGLAPQESAVATYAENLTFGLAWGARDCGAHIWRKIKKAQNVR